MAGKIKHRFVSAKSQSPDNTLVSKNEWNDSLVVSEGTNGHYFMRDSGQSDGWQLDNIWARMPVIDVTKPPYNATGDGATDDTAAIQAAINVFSNQSISGAIFFPRGTYKTTATLEYISPQTGYAMAFLGEFAGGAPSGATIQYAGSAGGTILRIKGGARHLIKDLVFNSSAAPKYGIELLSNQAAGGSPLFATQIQRCVISGASGVDSAGIRIGDSGFQASEIVVNDTTIINPGALGSMYYGIITSGANCKNFTMTNCAISGMRYGIHYAGSGFFLVKGTSFASCTIADVRPAAGHMTLIGYSSEGSTMIATGSTGANPGSLTIIGGYFASSTCNVDQYVINFGGTITLIDCHLVNNTTPTVTEPRVKAAEGGGATINSAIVSMNNNYANVAGDYAPLYNGSDQHVVTGSPINTAGYNVLSINDARQTFGGGGFRYLWDIQGKAASNHALRSTPSGNMTGITQSRYGEIRRAYSKMTYTYNAFFAASTIATKEIIVPPRCRLVSAMLDTRIPYSGLAGTITLQLGISGGGTELILAHDVKGGAILVGDDDADLGTGLARATAVQGGALVSWSTSPTLIYLRMISGTGNIGDGSTTNLASGETDVHLIYETMV